MSQTHDPGAVGTTTVLGAAALHSLGPGTARVQVVDVGEHETLMTLTYPHGRQVEVSVPDVPRHSNGVTRPPGAMRPLAVLMTNGPATLDCSVLCTSKNGPTRVPISLAEAIALCDSGVHTVLRNG